jgi:hypothetical protein
MTFFEHFMSYALMTFGVIVIVGIPIWIWMSLP